MAKKTTKAAPADGASTAANLQAAWPFPTVTKTVEFPSPVPGDPDAVATATFEEPAGERIRADAIRLYTDPDKNRVERVALEQLIECPFNPRTRYDPKALAELADTIRGVGVMQPLLARPVDYAQISHNSQPVQAYEIVFGHRRYRAAKIAGEGDVPVIVRELTDAQSAQLQAIENLQREDLDEIEEAKGYASYLQAHGVSKDQLAEELGLSRTHVYARLKLLNAVPSVQEACQAGEIQGEVALFISRLATPKLQDKALASLRSNGHDLEDGGKKSVRRIREFLKERFTLKLGEALFDTKDGALLAHAGACTDCPKRTGNAPEFQDLCETREGDYRGHTQRGEPNLCTDPDCFEAKKKAHLASKAAALEAKGKTVITGGKARSAISATGEVKGGYIALKDVKAELAKAKGKKGNEGIEVTPVIIQNPRDGKTVEVVKVEDLKVVGVKVKQAPAASGGRTDWQQQQRQREEERQKQEAKAAVETKVNCAILAAVRQAAAGQPLSAFALQLIAGAALSGIDYQQRNLMAQLHECKSADDLRKKVGQLPVDRLTTLLLDCALVDNVVAQSYGPRDKPEPLLAAAKHYGVDVAAIRKAVMATAADTKTEDLLKGAEQQAEEEDEAAEV